MRHALPIPGGGAVVSRGPVIPANKKAATCWLAPHIAARKTVARRGPAGWAQVVRCAAYAANSFVPSMLAPVSLPLRNLSRLVLQSLIRTIQDPALISRVGVTCQSQG